MNLNKNIIDKIIHEMNSKPQENILNDSCSYTKIAFERTNDTWLFDEIELLLPKKLHLTDNFRGCKYIEGCYMKEHMDGDYSNAYLSGGILLNNDYEGGEFMFGSEKLKAEVGEIFTFGRNILHNINTVKKGIRYSLHFHVMNQKSTI